MGQMVDSSDTEHQISDGVCDLGCTTPLHGRTMHRAHPDHAGLAPLLSDGVGVIHVACPLTPPGIELTPGGRLDSDGVGHLVCRLLVIPL